MDRNIIRILYFWRVFEDKIWKALFKSNSIILLPPTPQVWISCNPSSSNENLFHSCEIEKKKSLSWCSIWRSYLFWCSKVEILYASVPKCNGKSDDWCLHIFSSLRKEWNMDGQKFGRCPHSLWKSLKKVSFDNISADFLTKKISCIQLIFKPQKQAEFSWYFSTGKQAQFSWT